MVTVKSGWKTYTTNNPTAWWVSAAKKAAAPTPTASSWGSSSSSSSTTKSWSSGGTVQTNPTGTKIATSSTQNGGGVFGTNASNPFVSKNFMWWDPGLPWGNVFTPKKPTITTSNAPAIDTKNQGTITPTPKIEPINQFGTNTQGWTKDQFVSRNNDLASNFATNKQTTDAQIRSELEKNVAFRNASEQDKLNTIADIVQRIPVAQTKIAATSEADAIAKQYNFKDFADFSAKAWADVKNQVQSLINDIAKYKQSGDTEAEAMAKGSLWEIMAQGTVLATAANTDTTQTLARVSNMNPQGQLAVMKYQLLTDAMKKWVTYENLPNEIKGTKEDVDNLLNGRWDKLGVQVDEATAKELTAELNERKSYADKQSADATAQQKLQLQRNEEDYQEAYRRQQQENKIMSENMSKLSRFTGIWFSSSWVEGMDYVFQQGQQALSDLTKLHDRSETDIQTAISQISDAYTHNTNLYNLAYKDSMRNATQAFQTDILNIQNQYGKTSDAAWTKIADVSKTYQTDLANLSKWRTEQQNEMNNQLRQRYKDTETLKLQQQAQNIDMLKTQWAYPDLFPQNNQSTPTQSTPSVDPTTVQKWLETLETKYKDGTTGGQCGAFANNYAENLWLGRIFKDPFTQKASFINSQTPKVWSFVMRDSGEETNGVKNGHVGIVMGVSGDDLLIKDSNGILGADGKGTQKVATRTVSLSKILSKDGWFFDPTIGWAKPGGSSADLNTLAEYLIDTQPRWQGYSDDDVAAYTKAIKKYAAAGDRPTVIQLFRNQVLKDKENSTLVKNAKFITSMVDQTQELMKKYEQEWGDMNIFNGTVQKVIEKMWSSGNDTLAQIGQNMGMLTADYIRQISGTAAADAEVARLTALLPNTTSTFNRNTLLSEWFKKRISTEARTWIEVTLGKNKEMLDEIFPELSTQQASNNAETPASTSTGTPRRK